MAKLALGVLLCGMLLYMRLAILIFLVLAMVAPVFSQQEDFGGGGSAITTGAQSVDTAGGQITFTCEAGVTCGTWTSTLGESLLIAFGEAGQSGPIFAVEESGGDRLTLNHDGTHGTIASSAGLLRLVSDADEIFMTTSAGAAFRTATSGGNIVWRGTATNTAAMLNRVTSRTDPSLLPGNDQGAGVGGDTDGGRISIITASIERLAIDTDFVNSTVPLTTDTQSTTLGVAATVIAITDNFVVVTGDGGANTVATITGGFSGMVLRMLFVDALVTITDTDAHTADTVDLSAVFTSADDTVLTLLYDGTSWYEDSRSVN